MLESIREIFNTANIPFESISFTAEEINGPSAMIQCIENEKKTPVVVCKLHFCQMTGQRLSNAYHAMVATGIKAKRQRIPRRRILYYLQCKNSYRDNPNQSGTFQKIFF